MCVSGRLKCGLIRWTGQYDNISFRIKTPFHIFNKYFKKIPCIFHFLLSLTQLLSHLDA